MKAGRGEAGEGTRPGRGLGGAGAARLAGQGAQMALSVLTLAVLARLLEPADFGLFALGGVWLGFLGVVRDFGLPLAAVHHHRLDDALLAAVARHNLRLQGGLLLASAVAGPLFAALYGDGRLRGLVWALSAATVVLGSAAPARARVLRRASFGALATVEGVAVAAGSVAAVAGAAAGAGYWALVLFHAGRSVTGAVLLVLLAGAGPPWGSARGVARDAGTRTELPASLRGYGRRTTWARFIGYLGRHLDRALLGLFIPAAALGFYQQARRWSTLPAQGLQAPLLEVVVSLLGRRRDDPAAFRAGFVAAARAAFCLAPPVLAFLVVEAPTAVALLLGEGWEPVVPLLRGLALAALVGAPLAVVKWLFQSLGHTRRQVRWATGVSLAQVAAVGLAAPAGAGWVVVALTLAAAVTTPASIAFASRGTAVRGRDFAAAAAAPALATALACGVVWWAGGPLGVLEGAVAAWVGGAAGALAGTAGRGVAAALLFALVLAGGLTLAGRSPRRLLADLHLPAGSPAEDRRR